MEELTQELRKYNSDDVFVIGGSRYTRSFAVLYRGLCYKINKSYIADKYFCNLDEEQNWEMMSMSDLRTYNDIQYKFTKYLNSKAADLFEPKDSDVKFFNKIS